MTTGAQNVAAGLGLSLALANMLNGPQRPALRGFITGPTASGSGGGGGGGGGPLHVPGLPGGGPFGLPKIPDIPLVPQGPITGLPFSPVSFRTAATGGISPWRALLEITAELAFIGGLVLVAEDYPAPVIVFLVALWLLFLMQTPHPWRSRSAAAAATNTVVFKGA